MIYQVTLLARKQPHFSKISGCVRYVKQPSLPHGSNAVGPLAKISLSIKSDLSSVLDRSNVDREYNSLGMKGRIAMPCKRPALVRAAIPPCQSVRASIHAT